MNNFFKKNRLLFIHLLFWGLYFSFFFYRIAFSRRGNDDDSYIWFGLLDAISQMVLLAGLSYLNYFILLPRFLKHRRVLQYIIEMLVPLAIWLIVDRYLKITIFEDSDPRLMRFLTSSRFLISEAVNGVFVVAFVAMLRFANDWFELEAKRKEVENEKLVAELKFLKEQINPHFLFNTLNNLYYLAQSKSEKTPVVISELSQMMRYMIYDSNQESVPVSKEIEYIENYISLEKLRLEESVKIDFEVSGNPDTLRISPYVFITFLENAFKHGLNDNDENAFIEAKLRFDGNKCHYTVKNSVPESNEESHETGIGLANVKRRLNLLYPERHKLMIVQTKDAYSVELEIEL